jgi:hypothetical protein
MDSLQREIHERLEALFRRCPTLCGFTVQQEDAATPAQLTCYPAPNEEQAEELFGEVAQVLAQLVEERPEGSDLLHGRTFARTVH